MTVIAMVMSTRMILTTLMVDMTLDILLRPKPQALLLQLPNKLWVLCEAYS